MESNNEVLQKLSVALTQQQRAVRAYEMMIGAATAGDKKLLRAMQREERRHYYLLEGIYEDLCGEAFRGHRAAVSMPRQYAAMLQVMICDKLDTIDYYERLDQELSCQKQRELMTIIISDQKEQARILAAIYRRLD